MGRPPKFTREVLQQAALRIVDEQGLEALSMRALANALGTGAMTLYNYVAQREDLDVLVVEAVAAQAAWVVPQGASWQGELCCVAKGVWQAVRAHPHAIPLVLIRRSRSPAVFAIAEALLAPLARAGLAGKELLVAFRAVTALVLGLAQGELAGPLALKAGESASETIARFRALPAERFPQLKDLAAVAAGTTAEEEFDACIEVLIRGIEAR